MRQPKPLRFALAFLCFLLLRPTVPATAATFSWTNDSGGNWSVLSNWSPNGVPGAGDTGIITAEGNYTVIVNDNESISNLMLGPAIGQVTLGISGGTFTLNGSATGNAQTVLAMTGGTLAGAGVFALDGPFTWSGGTMDGVVHCNGGSVTASSVNMYGGQIINTGMMGWSANPVFMYDGALLSNSVGGTLNVTNAAWNNEGGGGGTIDNAGLMNIWASSTVDVPLTNFATIDVDSGVLGVGDGGTNMATILVASGATFNPSGGTFACVAGSTIAGQGNLEVSGGTVNLGAALNLTGTWNFLSGTANYTGTTTSSNFPIIISGGTVIFDGTGPLSAASVVFTGGIMGGSQLVSDSGEFTWSGGTMDGVVQCNGGSVTASSVNMYGGQIINTGMMGWSANPVFMYDGALLSNTASGTLNVTNAAWNNEGGGGGTIANAGLMNIWASSTVDVPLTNFATIDVDSGVLGVGDGGTNLGTIMVASGATFNPSGGTFACVAGSTIAGPGNLDVSGGTVNLGATLNLTGTWSFLSGTAYYTGTTTSSNFPIIVSGGTVIFDGTGPLSAASVAFTGGIMGGSQLVSDSGEFTWSGGTMDGVVQCNGGSVTASSVNMYGGQIINTGMMGWSANPVFMYDGALLSNTASGTLNVTNAAWNNEGGGGGTIANAGQFNVWGGSSSSVPFDNSGVVNFNSGTFTLNGGVTLTNDTLNFTISSATTFATLALTGPCSLNSTTLDATASGYSPAVGDTFPLIAYGSETGLFNALKLPSDANWGFDYGQTVFSLTVLSLARQDLTLQVITPAEIENGFTLLMLGPIGSNYSIQAASDSRLANWATLTNFTSVDTSYYYTDTTVTNYAGRVFRAVMH